MLESTTQIRGELLKQVIGRLTSPLGYGTNSLLLSLNRHESHIFGYRRGLELR